MDYPSEAETILVDPPKLVFREYKSPTTTSSGWWFGTFFIVPYIGIIMIPTDELIFFRGVAKSHQPEFNPWKIWSFPWSY
jgi:hypothetical protein